MSEFNWRALHNAQMGWLELQKKNSRKNFYSFHYSDKKYREWMISEWGIEHGEHSVRVVDNAKFLLFLVKWS